MGKFVDLTGQTFGCLKVLGRNPESQRVAWNYKCLNCGTTGIIRTDGLKREPKKCKECKYGQFLGKRYGKLVVLEQGKTDKNGHRYWICKCDCGNIKEISGTNLQEGKTISCGCEHKRIVSEKFTKDLVGKKFGMLTVIERSSKIGERLKWLCQCDCGTFIEVQGNNLQSGHTQSCGCIKSLGEKRIREILNNLKIKYQTEYIFNNLPKYRFDFVIFNQSNEIKFIIEFDGKQHFQPISTWHQTEKDFLAAQLRDQEKNAYCKANGLILIRIPYYDLNKLNELYLLKLMEEAQTNEN